MFAVLSVVGAIVACLIPAVPKLVGVQKMREGAQEMGIPFARYRLIGVLELAAFAGLLIGIWWPALGVAAGIGMVLLLAGALGFHVKNRDGLVALLPAVVCEILMIAYLVVAFGQL